MGSPAYVLALSTKSSLLESHAEAEPVNEPTVAFKRFRNRELILDQRTNEGGLMDKNFHPGLGPSYPLLLKPVAIDIAGTRPDQRLYAAQIEMVVDGKSCCAVPGTARTIVDTNIL